MPRSHASQMEPSERSPARSPVVAHMQRVGVLCEIPRLLLEMEVDPGPLLAEVGVEPSLLSDMEAHIPFPVVSDLLIRCMQATGRPDFVLAVGAAGRLKHIGVVGRLLASADDLRTAWTDYVANHPRYVRGAGVYLIDQGEEGVMIGHRVHSPGLPAAAAFSAGAVAMGRSLALELCGVEPARVLLSLPRPEDLAPYRQAFGRATLVFEAEHFGLVFPRSALARRLPTADPRQHAELRRYVAERWIPLQSNLAERVMRVIVPLALTGSPSLKTAAELLGMHPRALNRALSAQGLTFREMVNEARFEMASQMLRDTRMSVGDLAGALGYSEVSAFTRFFTTRAGLAPSEWRRGLISPQPEE